MNLPPELVAKWLPDWREFAELGAASAEDPAADPVRLAAVADKAADWPSPFGARRDQYVGAVLIWTAKAFCRQDSALMRETLAGVLREAALAFQARLVRIAEPQAPVIPLRRRRDIDDVED